jgi:hypothetical protein
MASSKMVLVASLALLMMVPHYVHGQQPSARGQGAGPSDLRTTTRTIYTDKTELFITFRPIFIVGESTRIGAHLSKLGGERFLPYSDVTVTVTLTVAGETARVSTDKPDRPGVFRLELKPTKAGMGNLVVDVAGPGGADKLVVGALPVYVDHAGALAGQGPNEDAGAIRYTKEQSWDENEYASAPVGRVALETGSAAQRVLAVPRTAIVDVGGVPHVYVQRNPEAFDLVEVKTGRNNGTYVEITQGLREGQRIVAKGGDKMPRK